MACLFLTYYTGSRLWIKGQVEGKREIRGVNERGRNKLKEKRKREEEKKESKRESGCRLLASECNSLFR